MIRFKISNIRTALLLLLIYYYRYLRLELSGLLLQLIN